MVLHHFGQFGCKLLPIEQISQAHTAASHLILVSWANAATGGADLLVAQRFLAGFVDRYVVRQDQRAGGGNAQTVTHRHAFALQVVDFVEQRLRREYDAVADQALHARAQNARRNHVQHRLHTVDHQGVASIVAALETYDSGRALGQEIDDLALALVAPLGADDNDIATTHAVYVLERNVSDGKLCATTDRWT